MNSKHLKTALRRTSPDGSIAMMGALAAGLIAALPVMDASAQATTDAWSTKTIPWRIDLEYQRYDVSKNVVQKPNDSTGTRFSVNDFAESSGNTAWLAAYAQVGWFFPKDEVRFVIAPFQQSGTAIPTTPILYDGAVFRAGVPLDVSYKFNTYRMTYDVPVFESLERDGWEFRIGGTIAVRDAWVKLSQPDLGRNFTSWGAVPLLYFGMTKELASGWRMLGEFDAFPAPGGGGLFDGSLKLAYAVTKNFALTVGGRYEFGGASDSTFYNFLRLWTATAGMTMNF
jgi:hypothetical protein